MRAAAEKHVIQLIPHAPADLVYDVQNEFNARNDEQIGYIGLSTEKPDV